MRTESDENLEPEAFGARVSAAATAAAAADDDANDEEEEEEGETHSGSSSRS